MIARWDRLSGLRETRLTAAQVTTGRKTALMSVVGYRTDGTDLNGVMEDAEGYENITVFSDCKQYEIESYSEQITDGCKILVERHSAVASEI